MNPVTVPITCRPVYGILSLYDWQLGLSRVSFHSILKCCVKNYFSDVSRREYSWYPAEASQIFGTEFRANSLSLSWNVPNISEHLLRRKYCRTWVSFRRRRIRKCLNIFKIQFNSLLPCNFREVRYYYCQFSLSHLFQFESYRRFTKSTKDFPREKTGKKLLANKRYSYNTVTSIWTVIKITVLMFKTNSPQKS